MKNEKTNKPTSRQIAQYIFKEYAKAGMLEDGTTQRIELSAAAVIMSMQGMTWGEVVDTVMDMLDQDIEIKG